MKHDHGIKMMNNISCTRHKYLMSYCHHHQHFSCANASLLLKSDHRHDNEMWNKDILKWTNNIKLYMKACLWSNQSLQQAQTGQRGMFFTWCRDATVTHTRVGRMLYNFVCVHVCDAFRGLSVNFCQWDIIRYVLWQYHANITPQYYNHCFFLYSKQQKMDKN